MKKYLIVLLSATLLVGLNSCKKESTESTAADQPAPTEQTTPAPETIEPAPEEVAPAKSASEMLKEFEDYVVAYADANNNMTKNPKKYQELAQQSQSWVQDMERVKGDLKPAEVKKYDKLIKDLANINNPTKK